MPVVIFFTVYNLYLSVFSEFFFLQRLGRIERKHEKLNPKVVWWKKRNHLFMKLDRFDVVKDIEEVGLDGVGVRGLAQDLQQGRVRDKEKTWKEQTLLLQIAVHPHDLKKKKKLSVIVCFIFYPSML